GVDGREMVDRRQDGPAQRLVEQHEQRDVSAAGRNGQRSDRPKFLLHDTARSRRRGCRAGRARTWLGRHGVPPVRQGQTGGHGGPGQNQAETSYGAPAGHSTGVYLQAAVDSPSAFLARLTCDADVTGTSLTFVRITAISASSLVIVLLPV